MAKLTARFDMQDKISKKLRALQGNLEGIEKYRRSLEKPMILKARDEATKKMKSITSYADKHMVKKRSITIEMADKFTKPAKGINRYLERRMPKSWAIAIEAKNKTKTVMENVKRYLNRHLAKPRYLLVEARDRATSVIHRISNYARRSLGKGYNYSVRAIDIASKTVGRIAAYTRTALPAYRNFTIRAIDRATNVIGSVKKALFSIPSMITVGITMLGGKQFLDSTLGAAARMELSQVQVTSLFGKNQKAAKEFFGFLNNAGANSMFSQEDFFGSGRAFVPLTKNLKELKYAVDITERLAASNPAEGMEGASFSIREALSGDIVSLAERFNLPKTMLKSIKNAPSLQKKLEAVDKVITDMGYSQEYLEKVNGTGYVRWQKLLDTTKLKFTEFGKEGLTAAKPLIENLNRIVEGKGFEQFGQFISDGITWSVKKANNSLEKLEKYFKNPDFKKLDFEGKVKFIMDDLGEWWDKTGRPWLADVSKDVGAAIFDGIVWGVKEGIKGIGSMWADAFKNPSLEGFAGAGIATVIAASIASLVLAPLMTGIKGVGKVAGGIWKTGKKVSGWFKKGKGPKPPSSSGRLKKAATSRKKPVYTQPWFEKGKKPELNRPNKKPSVFSKIPKGFGKGASNIARFGKKIPVLGAVLGGLSILTAPKGKKAEAAGGLGGGLGGAATGAAIGSVVPGVGTAIGGVLGGVAGSFGGEALGGWLGDNWDTIKTKAGEAAESVGSSFNKTKEKIASTLFSGDWWSEKWEGVKGWTAEKWTNANETWNTVKETISSTIFNGEWWSEKWNGVKETATSTIFSAGWWAEQGGKVYGFLESTIFSGEWWSQKWQEVKELTAGTMFSSEWWKEKWELVKTWTAEKWDSAVSIWNSVKNKFSETVFSSDWWHSKWESVKGWTQTKWDSAQVVWSSVKTKMKDTIFSGDWWLGKWEDVKGWTQEKWDSAQSVWDSVKTSLGDTLFDGEWWKGKWGQVKDWAQEKLSGVGSWVSGLVEDVKERFSSGREKGNKAAKKYANGGYINKPHIGLVGEAGPEMIIPLSANRRGRAMDLYNQTGKMLGVRPYANGGQVGGSVKPVNPKKLHASVNVGAVSVQGIDKEAKLYGESFTNAVARGINGNVVPISTWKKNNIETPMQGVIKQAVDYGANTVTSFSAGQNATPTNTTAYLNRQVKTPFKVIEGGAPQWGSGTVAGFRSGQNATHTGTKPYLFTNVHTPFNETKAKGSSWGSGTASEFISGLRSKGDQVREASKYLAKQVEKTFKQELGIHSPSRVMAQLGKFASLGIVKGLGDVDIKEFAEKQAGSLASAFAGMGSIGGNISEWIQAAMTITGVPSSWLGPLSVIAQKESGGNPKAQNNWDINAKRGIPSKGLMQTIGPTFNAFKGKGLNDIFNPVHNAVAAINYIKSRYGNVFNVPGIKSMASGGAYRGYWKGTKGPLRSAETAWVGERGPELVNLPRGSEVLSHRESKRVASNQVSAAIGTGSKSSKSAGRIRDIIIQITGDNHFNGDSDMNKLTNKVKRVIEELLDEEYNEGGELVVYD
ncbi:transglycosylase SLT domain-containing protein [Virgibacillus dokdonensis]|uniref:Transglycosylase SLT domain protein n=1 Tax=Virgibacillus dokdonensis TaxID=302167 RepID=A0A2K9J0H0_9BACI|nr:transglycosylase SLT domain-containing protein [Virgibacillus dokdonensis]AUJ25194.1 Transglycosylase SLT domain protein [Virgibacillus dokdonensis]